MGRPEALLAVDGGIATITLSNAPVNALHPDLLSSFKVQLEKAQADPNVRAIVVTGANGRFCAGFDINQFAQSDGNGLDNTVNDTLCKLVESGKKPTVAAVAGLALGGGCEVALACNARVGAKGVKIGLPELTLGILPGFGGTQRLPRIVGLELGLKAILTSKPVGDKAALAAGFFSEIVEAKDLIPTARRIALELADGKIPRVESLYYDGKLPKDKNEGAAIVDFAASETKRRAPNLTHPLLALNAIKVGILEGGLKGLVAEADAFETATALSTHKSLVHFFFASRATKKVKGVTDAGLKPRPIKKLAVVGGGLMGSGIATASIFAGITVLLKEINQQFLDAGVGRVRANVLSGVKKGRYTQAKADAILSLLKPTLTYDGWKDVDLVIEAAVERPDLKQKIFKELRDATGPSTILSSNTSTIDINVIGEKIPGDRPRILGAHFFSPAHIMPLLEIVKTEHTDPQVVLDTIAYGAKIGKTPVVVGNCAGFAVNRVFFPYNQAAMLLVDGGVSPYVIDKAIKDFGMPMGPFRLLDLVGVDVGYHIAPSFIQAFPDRVYKAPLVPLLFDANKLGEKTGSGLYAYDAKRKATPNKDLAPFLAKSRETSALTEAQKRFAQEIGSDPKKIVEFIFFPVINESARVVAEGIVDKPADLDVATILSMGFPAYRGGIIFWGDIVGAKHIRDSLTSWGKVFANKGLEGFFSPSAYLNAAADKGTKLSAGVQSAKI